MATILLLHIGLFYALQNGTLWQAVPGLPHEVFATLIANPQPARPKAMPRARVTPSRLPVQRAAAPAIALTAPYIDESSRSHENPARKITAKNDPVGITGTPFASPEELAA